MRKEAKVRMAAAKKKNADRMKDTKKGGFDRSKI